VKPFYYWQSGQNFAFASEAKALLKLPQIAAELNHAALSDYLSLGYITGNNTIFSGIRKLEPGHCLQFDDNGLKKNSYWSLADKIRAGISSGGKGDILALIDSAVEY